MALHATSQMAVARHIALNKRPLSAFVLAVEVTKICILFSRKMGILSTLGRLLSTFPYFFLTFLFFFSTLHCLSF